MGDDLALEIQERAFRPGELVQTVILMCGGHFNSFYLAAQEMEIAQVIYLFEHWLEVRKRSNPNPRDPFKGVEYH